MATIHEVVGYIPLQLVSDTLAVFLSGYGESDWTGITTKPTAATAAPVREGHLVTLTLTDYLTEDNLTDLDPWGSQSTVGLRLEYHNGTEWGDDHAMSNFDSSYFDDDDGTPPTAANFIVRNNASDLNKIEIQIPRKISGNVDDKYRLWVEIKQDDA